jgi:hypothetical protein
LPFTAGAGDGVLIATEKLKLLLLTLAMMVAVVVAQN